MSPTTWVDTHTHSELSEKKGRGKQTTYFAPFSVDENASIDRREGPPAPAEERALRPRDPHCSKERGSLISEPSSDIWRHS